jgi:hypothetical protein
VYLWNDPHYPATTPHDVLRLGLPEGVVRAGGQVSGFIYFQNTAGRADRLQLSWTAHTPDGKTIETLTVPFVVVED